MNSRIVIREIIQLNASQTRMIISGWGEEVVNSTTVERITYLSDGLKVKGYIAYPNNTDKKYPCIIWNRGGYRESGAIDSFTARGIYGQLASWGYVVFASQYRGNAGSEGKEELGGADVNDILNLIPLADEIENADKNNWGIEGWSRGGMMTYLTLKENKNFKCAILSGAISNLEWNANDNSSLEKTYKDIIGNKDLKTELKKRSAHYFVKDLPDIPYLLMHGGTDDIVSNLQTLEMAKLLSLQNYNYRMVIFEEGDHFLKSYRKEVDQLRKDWLKKYLSI